LRSVGIAERELCEQIQTSSAEGRGYYRIARASSGETQTHLRPGFHRGYWTEPVFKKAWDVSEGALKTTTGLLKSRLAKIEDEEKEKRRRKREP
jgi:hypothetical protein